MIKLGWAALPVVAVVAVWGYSHHRTDTRQLGVAGGKTTIHFFPSILEGYGLKVAENSTTDGDPTSGEPSKGYLITASNQRFTLIDGRLSNFDGGRIEHAGGFKLQAGSKVIDASKFTIVGSRKINDGLEVQVPTETGPVTMFQLENPRVGFDFKGKELDVESMDMVLSYAGAQKLGKPELTGKLIGMMSVFAKAEPLDGRGDVVEPEPEAFCSADTMQYPIDVSISAMSSLTVAGRTGTYPNGLNGLTMSTTSCNVGSNQIPWDAPMQTTHPMIAMNLYRLLNGRFEQVGFSWMKHGFFATNSPGCGTCSPAGTGALLGVGCSDTYGTSNNSDRNYLGGRDEVNAFTGVWNCNGSYFSNYINDCVRRNNGSGLDAVAHRLVVRDQDMGNAGAQYFYEAYYVNANEVDKYNSAASREATMTWSGTAWNISTTAAAQVQGVAINRWGEYRDFAQPRTDGDLIVAVQTTNLGGGMWHYEYAVYNHDCDRQIRSFSVPVPIGATVQNIGFHDIDFDGTNDWAGAVSGASISWSTGTFGSSTANPLKFSSLFNFRFDCNVPPANSSASLDYFKPGTGTTIAAVTTGPLMLSPFQAYQVMNGVLFSGNLQSLAESDDDKLTLGPSADTSRAGSGMIGSITAPTATPNSITVGVESSNNLSQSQNPTQTIALLNWGSGLYEVVDTRAMNATDATATVSITSNASRFVEPTSREVRVRILHTSSSSLGNRWKMFIDKAGVKFN